VAGCLQHDSVLQSASENGFPDCKGENKTSGVMPDPNMHIPQLLYVQGRTKQRKWTQQVHRQIPPLRSILGWESPLATHGYAASVAATSSIILNLFCEIWTPNPRAAQPAKPMMKPATKWAHSRPVCLSIYTRS